ncbi:Golgi-associated plant pathogenesis-related protein 1-like [Saccoglossus kowalevskii]|uniref:Golgi-associated plant pathogenesis-related protein 1-like isoform X1 n=1 Tax=Saccoglossus kowalevskii TaxID=10224 RepID=A0ABM0MC54_SACKO|nr:PREDICTED: golgi-associated plant pathogenesis-related protein 1-like isoform X1 [Saccoglossus kowalevskii]XP_006817595.1 PREDICTED: golgi-associated plant pathogenesis-related protein 1-like isoform X2 [Saccoglossus kowalevskii]
MGKSQSKSKERSSDGRTVVYSERRVITKTTTTRTVTGSDGQTTITTETHHSGSDRPSSGFKRFFTKKSGDSKQSKQKKKKKDKRGKGKFSDGESVKDVKPDASFLKTLRQDCLKAHNKLRSKHRAPSMKLDNALNKQAQDWAEQIAKSDRFGHRPNNKYGENIYYAMNSRGLGTLTGEGVVQSWYDEIKKYNFKSGGFSSGTGHFTQVVWKASTGLGIGFAPSKNKANTWYVVANYNPAGNVQGQYQKNVSAK